MESDKIGTFDWVKRMLGFGRTQPPWPRPMGSVEIIVYRNGTMMTAYVDIDYFSRPRPGSYWIDGDRGDNGEVILGQACDEQGRKIDLSETEQEEAIEAFKVKE